MGNVSQTNNVPDDEFVSRAEQAAQLAEDAAAAAAAAQAAAEQALADTLAALAAQELGDHADTTFTAPGTGQVVKRSGNIWVNDFIAFNELLDVDIGGAADGTSIIKTGGVYIPYVPVDGANFLLLAGGTMTGPLILAGDPTLAPEAATKSYVDNAVGGVSPYDIAAYFDGLPTADEDIFKFVAVRNYYLESGLTSSVAVSNVSATAQTDFDIRKNGVSIGTIRFAAAASTASFIFAANVNFVSGDTLEVVAPTTPDVTLEDISITLVGNLGEIT